MYSTIVERVDLGTPAPQESTNTVSLTINSHEIEVPEGTSIFRAAALAGVSIPKLCATDAMPSFGSCRMCLVEVEGRNGYPASCTTPVEEGMQVNTHTEKIESLRHNVMELYISDHPLECLVCPANGDCELQDTAGEVGLREVRYGYEGKNHLEAPCDDSNPYFTFDPSLCIACTRCVRACDDIQGTFALSLVGRGFDAQIVAGQDNSFFDSDCVSCGSCVQHCPTGALIEKTVIEQGQPEHSVITTCAYCGVGCTFKAEMKGEKVVRMTPWDGSAANHGHSCVKGRFAWGYATHAERITKPMIRNHYNEPWQEVSWQEAISFAAERLKSIQAEHGRNSAGVITSSRCTNEETYLMQKFARATLGTNNVDTCARVCHSPTGYGLKQTLGESAGTQDFDSVADTDVIMVIGANPTEAHPVFGSRLKQRIRQGAKLIVVDPRAIELVDTPHVRADYHLALRPGTNTALLTSLAHVIVTEQLHDEAFIKERCEEDSFNDWLSFVSQPENSPEHTESTTQVPAELVRQAARLYATGGNAAIYYGLGVTEHSQGSTTVMAIANLAMATGNIGKKGVGVNPLRGQNNVQGSCDMGSFPHELPGYRHISDSTVRADFETRWQVDLDPEPGLRIPNMFDAAIGGKFKALYCQGEDILQSDPNTQHVQAALMSLDCLIVQDLFLNETAKYAHVFLPGSSFLEKNGTFTNSERRISRVRKVATPRNGYEDWEITCMLSEAMGYPMEYSHPSEIMDEVAALTPTFSGVSYQKLDEMGGNIQWPCNEAAPDGTEVMHVDEFVRGKGRFLITQYVPTEEATSKRFPLLLTTGRILSQYNVGAQTRRTDNVHWHDQDYLEIHPEDAQERGINELDLVEVTSRAGTIQLAARISPRILKGVVYTTFHFPESGANVVTTEISDWATNCPEYKVTAVQVQPVRTTARDSWQDDWHKFDHKQQELLPVNGTAEETSHHKAEALVEK